MTEQVFPTLHVLCPFRWDIFGQLNYLFFPSLGQCPLSIQGTLLPCVFRRKFCNRSTQQLPALHKANMHVIPPMPLEYPRGEFFNLFFLLIKPYWFFFPLSRHSIVGAEFLRLAPLLERCPWSTACCKGFVGPPLKASFLHKQAPNRREGLLLEETTVFTSYSPARAAGLFRKKTGPGHVYPLLIPFSSHVSTANSQTTLYDGFCLGSKYCFTKENGLNLLQMLLILWFKWVLE